MNAVIAGLSLQPFIDYQIATIATGQSLSNALNLRGGVISRLWLPASMSGTRISIQGSLDGTTWSNSYDDLGAEVALPFVAGTNLLVPIEYTLGMRMAQLRIGTAASPSPQSAAISIGVIIRTFD